MQRALDAWEQTSLVLACLSCTIPVDSFYDVIMYFYFSLNIAYNGGTQKLKYLFLRFEDAHVSWF